MDPSSREVSCQQTSPLGSSLHSSLTVSDPVIELCQNVMQKKKRRRGWCMFSCTNSTNLLIKVQYIILPSVEFIPLQVYFTFLWLCIE